jgi:hypothetical protein
MNIAACFGKLVNRIQPSDSERVMAQQHLATIKTRLAATFNIRKFPATGSIGRGTFIRGASDADLMALISRKDFRWGEDLVTSRTALERIRIELLKRYPNTPVRTDVHAVVVPFSQGVSVDVVPAVFDGMLPNNWPLYHIPDGAGGWLPSCPELHNKYIREADARSGNKLRRVAQIVKYWRECRSPRVPLSSFHIEMLLASEGICIGVKSYAACVTETLQLIAERECRSLQDPLGFAGHISAVKTDAQREYSLASVRHSREHAKSACLSDYGGNVNEAWRQWDIVFNYTFPK